MKTLVGVFFLFMCSGCSVYMAASGDKEPNLGAFGVGSTRGQVEQQLGAAKASTTLENGDRQDLYEYTLENEKSPGRAIGHGVMDVLTLGIWEVVGTPIEAGNQGNKRALKVLYGPDSKVKSID
jgi:hypothetical protein